MTELQSFYKTLYGKTRKRALEMIESKITEYEGRDSTAKRSFKKQHGGKSAFFASRSYGSEIATLKRLAGYINDGPGPLMGSELEEFGEVVRHLK